MPHSWNAYHLINKKMKVLKKAQAGYPWTLRRMGGIYQVQLKTVDDLRALKLLDPKLWVALSCPVNDLEVDQKTLEQIDYNKDGRVRIEEILAAVEWTLERLSRPESLFEGGDLPLEAINTSDAEGAALFASARQILANAGIADAGKITVDQAADTASIYGQSRLNGDGVIAEDATGDADVHELILDIIKCLGPDLDRSGGEGVSQKKMDTFFTEIKVYENWWSKGEADSKGGADVFPLGDATPAGFECFIAVEHKIDDYFARCHLVAFDERAEAPLNHDASLYRSLAADDFSKPQPMIVGLPLARITKVDTLPLVEGVNPEWEKRIRAFVAQVAHPLLSSETSSLTLVQWKGIKSRFKRYREWRQAKPVTGVEQLSISRIREWIASDAKAALYALLKEDRTLAPRMQAVDSVEKLARFHRDLIRVLNNFVNFNDFYDENETATFQAGTLYLDGRECQLCLRVNDPVRHAALAGLSRAFIAYCECRRKDSPRTFHIAAVFLSGDSTNLIVGRNGVFRDTEDKLWDTTIVRLIENPMSIREAFLMPYIRVGRFIGDQLEKWAVTRDKAIQKQMETGIEQVGTSPAGNPPRAKGNSTIGGVAGMIAAGGIALGAVGAGLASLFETMKSLSWWEFPLVTLGLVLMVSCPSMMLAWLKIRQRTLAPLLDASGWAVNGRTLISMELGRVLTRRAIIPIEARCQFDERNRGRRFFWLMLGLIFFGAAAGWTFLFL